MFILAFFLLIYNFYVNNARINNFNHKLWIALINQNINVVFKNISNINSVSLQTCLFVDLFSKKNRFVLSRWMIARGLIQSNYFSNSSGLFLLCTIKTKCTQKSFLYQIKVVKVIFGKELECRENHFNINCIFLSRSNQCNCNELMQNKLSWIVKYLELTFEIHVIILFIYNFKIFMIKSYVNI